MDRFVAPSGAASLAGVDTGGTAAASIFLHAGVADHRSWLPLIGLLSNRRAIAYDRRGFGESSWTAEPFSHVVDLEAVFDDRGLERATLIGNSQGGRIAIDFALERPERVTALVLIAPAISGEPEPPIESYSEVIQRQVAVLEAAEEAEDLDAVNEIEAQLWLDGPEQPPGRVAGANRRLFLEMNGRALAAPPTGDAIEPPSAYERFSGLEMPVVFICGAADFADVIDRCRHLASQAPRGTFELIDGVAHLPQLEKPEIVARGIIRALSA